MTLIHIIGIGLDGADGLNQKIKDLIAQATLLVGSDRHLNYFPHHPAPRLVLRNLTKNIQEIRQYLNNDNLIVILVSGDPLFFGLGRLLLAELPAENIIFHPHLSSIQQAFSSIKIPWQDAKLISIHGRSWEQLTLALQKGVEKIAILTDPHNTPEAIARHYLALDLPTQYQFWVCENLGGKEEKINCFSPQELPQQTYSSLNVVILIRQTLAADTTIDLASLPLFGLPDSTFICFRDRPGLMTKREIRIAILGELALQPGQIIWDIGAGTGSVAAEIARLCPTSQIYAIEKTAIGANLISQNCQRLQVSNVTCIQGTAPEILTQLPTPQRIFIGGSGGNLTAILAHCQKTLVTDGVIVLALATIEHLHTCLEWLRSHNCNYRLLQLQISRSVPIAQLNRFTPLNPVTLVTVYKHETLITKD